MIFLNDTLTEKQLKAMESAFYADAAAIKAYCKSRETSCDGCPFMKVEFSECEWCKLNFPKKWEL